MKDDMTHFLFPVLKGSAYTFTRTQNPSWPELENVLVTHKVKLPLTFLPPLLYLETLCMHAARSLTLPITFGSVYDLPWTVAAVACVHHDCIISSNEVFPYLLKKLEKENLTDTITTLILIGERDDVVPFPTGIRPIFLSHPLL